MAKVNQSKMQTNKYLRKYLLNLYNCGLKRVWFQISVRLTDYIKCHTNCQKKKEKNVHHTADRNFKIFCLKFHISKVLNHC